MTEFSEHFLAKDKTRIFYRRFRSEKPCCALVVVHGLGEHSGRYKEFAHAMVRSNIEVFAMDLRGHGRTEGRRGCVDSLRTYGEDINAFLEFIPKWIKGIPLFVLGHSLGGLIVSHWSLFQTGSHSPRGVILSSPALGIAVKVPALKAAVGRGLSKLMPDLTMDNELDPKLLSRDEAEVRAYVDDPLVHRRISTRLFTEMVAAMDRVQADGAGWKFPLLMILGESDRIVSVDAAKAFFANVGHSDKTLNSWPEFKHEPFHEIGRPEAFDTVGQWILKKVKSEV
ncbi:MAG: lysophospholipase [Nitrospirae bacterium]|nr:lysophospholipase [Nitrospirota bacterium]